MAVPTATAVVVLLCLPFSSTRQIYDEDCKDYPSVDSLPAGCRMCDAATGYLTVTKEDCPAAFTEELYGVLSSSFCNPGSTFHEKYKGELTKFKRMDGSIFDCGHMPYNPNCPILRRCTGKKAGVPCNGSIGSESCCDPVSQCNLGEGDCDDDRDCAGSLVCGTDNCRAFNPAAKADADCCMTPEPVCNGEPGTESCCTPNQPCGEGQGDCDEDEDCTGSLVCGTNNCRATNPAADPKHDCCMKPPGDVMAMLEMIKMDLAALKAVDDKLQKDLDAQKVVDDKLQVDLTAQDARLKKSEVRTAVCGYRRTINEISTAIETITFDGVDDVVYNEVDTTGGVLGKDGYFTAGVTGVYFVTVSAVCELENQDDLCRVYLEPSSGNYGPGNLEREIIFSRNTGSRVDRQSSGSRYLTLAKDETMHLVFVPPLSQGGEMTRLKFCVSLYSVM